MTSPQFSLLQSDNIDSCYAAHADGQFRPWSKAVFSDCQTPPYFAYKLSLGEQLFGYYIGLQVLDEITLMDISIVRQYRAQGWGKVCIEDFLQQCQKRKGHEIWLEVRESNQPAINLYSNHGFSLIEKRKSYYETEYGFEAALIMKCNL